MASSTDIVSLVLKLEQLRQFVSGTDKAAKGVANVGTAAEKSGKKAGIGWKGLAKFAGGAAALYGAQRYIRGAVSATEDLGKSTLMLSRTTGMDVETASAWASIAKSRGLQAKQLQVGFVKLSKEMEKSRAGTAKEAQSMAALNAQYKDVAAQGGKKAPAALARLTTAMTKAHASGQKVRDTLASLGVTQDAIASGNTNKVLNQVADGIAKIENPARRAALAQQLFGRGGQALLPILMKGRKGIADQMAVVRKYGDVLGVKTVGQLKELMASQREQKIAQDGIKVQLGQALLPVLLQLDKLIISIAQAIAPLVKNGTALKLVVAGLAAVFVAWKVATLAQTVAQTLFNAQLGISVAIIFGVVLAVAALAIGFYFLYKRVGWFRKAVDVTWSWIKAHWPLLLGILTGPFGLAAVFIITHFKQVKAFVIGVVDAIKGAFVSLLNFVKTLPTKMGGYLKQIPGLGKIMGLASKLGGLVPHFATGGVMPYHGAAMVGERGPELVTLPRGARVTPMSAPATAVAGGGGGGMSGQVVIPVYLDGKEIARSVAKVTSDKLARR